MKTKYFPVLGLILPLLSHAGLTSKLRELDEKRLETALCNADATEKESIEKALSKVEKRGTKGKAAANEVIKDYSESLIKCTSSALSGKENLLQEISNIDPAYPIEIMKTYQDQKAEWERDSLALSYVKSKEATECPQMETKDIYNNITWHDYFLANGWPCTARSFMNLSQSLNVEAGYDEAQNKYLELSKLSLKELKKRFKEVYKIGTKEQKLKLAFVPQLSWENGTLNMTFPYKYFTKPTELTSYRFLKKEMRKLGVPTTVIERNSLAPLEEQVKVTTKKLLELDGPHMLISRSMGSRVVREMVAENDPEINNKIISWLNVGGTPHGSVIARYKIHPDTFYRSVFSSVIGAFKLPIGLISKDPRVASHIGDTLLSAIVRSNLKTMESAEARQISESDVPVLNAVMVRDDYERATEKVDPVWMHMLQYGPTEGSSLLTGAAVDTSNSVRLVLDSDHLGFWKYQPEEALAIFLRLMIVSAEEGLNR